MKTLRFLLVMIFVLAFLVGSAGALGEGTETGYLPLPIRGDSSIPLQVQAHQAFLRVLPVLMAAQGNGSILAFQPMYGAGVVKITFAAGTRPETLGGMAVHADLNEAASMLHPPAVNENELRGIFDPTFTISLYDARVWIFGLEAGDRVTGSLFNKSGLRLAVLSGSESGSGYVTRVFEGSYPVVLPGYKVLFKIYNSGGVLRGTWQATAANVTIDAFNKAAGIASGKGPAGKPYTATWYHDNLTASPTTTTIFLNGTVSSSGTWSKDFGTKPLRGGDTVGVSVQTTTRFRFFRILFVPYSACYLGNDYFVMYGYPRQAASMTITHAGVPYTYTGKFDIFTGYFQHDIEDAAGMPVLLAPGDKFMGTNIPLYSLPKLTAVVNYNTNVVSGKAPPDKYFTVWVWDAEHNFSTDAWVHSDAYGNYSIDLNGIYDLIAEDPLLVLIEYRNPGSGNVTYLNKSFGP